MAGQFGPAVDSDLALLGVQSDDDLSGEGAAGVVQEAGILDRRRADDDVTYPVVEDAFDGIKVTDAATKLDGDFVVQGIDDGTDGAFVLLFAGKSAVEINDMQTTRTLLQPVGGLFAGRIGENRGIVHEALFQADALSILQVNRGNDQHVLKRVMVEEKRI